MVARCDVGVKGLGEWVDGPADSRPRAGNTGAQPTGDVERPSQNRVLIDWLAFTVHASVDAVVGFLGLADWVELDRGGLGYRRCRMSGAVRVYYEGADGMGVHVVVSGRGCRELEACGRVVDWPGFIREVIEFGGKVRRLDVAFDDVEGRIEIRRVIDAWREGRVVSRWKKAQVIEALGCGGQKRGLTFAVGSRESDTFMRIYDKGAEQGVEGHWVRLELEFKGDRAHGAAEGIGREGVGVVAGWLYSYFDIKRPTADSNRWRWPTEDWWMEFLGWCRKARISLCPVVRTLEKVYQWLDRQVAPSLAMLVLAMGGEVSSVYELIHSGRMRLRNWHRNLIKQYRGVLLNAGDVAWSGA